MVVAATVSSSLPLLLIRLRPLLSRLNSGSHPVTKPCITTPTKLDTTQYSARPLGKFSVKNPNIAGIIHSIIRLVEACRWSAVGIVVIFCMIHIDTPTKIGMTNGDGSGRARSIQRKLLFIGITLWTWGSQSYRCLDRPTRLSGFDGTVCRIAWYSPIQMGNWMNMGPRQPSGLTPRSRYSAIVSWDAFDLSFLFLSWISFMRGWSWLIDLICRLCLTVSGINNILTRSVKATIAIPNWEKHQ